MIVFAVVAVVMLAVAVGALVPFLWRRRRIRAVTTDTRAVYRERLAELEAEWERGNLSDAGFAEARDELEREVLADADRVAHEPARSNATSAPAVAVTVAVAVPVIAVALYAATGEPGLISQSSAQQLSEQAVQRYRQMPPGKRVEELEAYVDSHPTAPRAWQLLGQAYREQQQFGDAFSAFQQARNARTTADATLIARQAEALYLANGRTFSASVKRLIDQALETEPRNPLALLLAGHAAMAEGRKDDAIAHWMTLKEIMPEGDRRRRQVERLLAQARGEGGGAQGDRARSASGQDQQGSSSDGRVVARVRLADGLAQRAADGTTVYVFAQSAQGGGPPLAVARTTVEALPTQVELSDAQAMVEGRSISQAERVVVTARVANSGGVRPQPGDLQGQSQPVPVTANAQAEVSIDRVVGDGGGNGAQTAAAGKSERNSSSDESGGGAGVTAHVSLDAAIADDARADMPVFVFAETPGGNGPPLAVARTKVANLPAAVALTDEQAMGSSRKISQAERVVVTARASSSGGVKPQSGDLQGQSEPVRVGPGVEVDVIIDRRIE